ncbi:hypothetical protein WKY82_10400 [Gordonia malaquae]
MHLFFFILGGLAGASIATLYLLVTDDDHLDVEIVDGEFVDGPQGRAL